MQRVQEEWSRVHQERMLLERESSRLDNEMIKMQVKTDSVVEKKEAHEREVEVLRFRCSSLQQSLSSLQEQLDACNNPDRERTSDHLKSLPASLDMVRPLEEAHEEKLVVSQLTEELKKERWRGEVLLDNLLIIEERFLLAEKEKNHAQQCCEALDYQLKVLLGASNEGSNPHDHNPHSNQVDVRDGQQKSTLSSEFEEFAQPLASVGELSPTWGSPKVFDDRALEAHTPLLDLVAVASDRVCSAPLISSLPLDETAPTASTPVTDCLVPAVTSFGTVSQSQQLHAYDHGYYQSELNGQNHVDVTVQESENAAYDACEDQRQLPRLSSSSLESLSSTSSSGTGDDFSNNDGNQTVRGKYPHSNEFADTNEQDEVQSPRESSDHTDVTQDNCRGRQDAVSRQPCASARGSRCSPAEPLEGPRSLPEFGLGRPGRSQDKEEGSDNLYQLLASLRPFDGLGSFDKKTSEGSSDPVGEFEKVSKRKRSCPPTVNSRYEDCFRVRALETFPALNTKQSSHSVITANDYLLKNFETDFMTSSPSQWNEPLNFPDALRSSHAQGDTRADKDARNPIGYVGCMLDMRQDGNVASTFPPVFSVQDNHRQPDMPEEVFVSTASVLIFDSGTQVPTNAKRNLEGHRNLGLGQHPASMVDDRDVAASTKPPAAADVSAFERKRADEEMLSCSLMRELDQEKEQLLQELRKLTAFEEQTQGKQRKKNKKRSPKRQQQRQEFSPLGAEQQVDRYKLSEDYHQQHLHHQRLQQQLQQVEYSQQQNNRRPMHNTAREQSASAQQEHHRSDMQPHLDTTTVSSLSFQFDSPTRDTTLEEGLLQIEQSTYTQESSLLSPAITHEIIRQTRYHDADSRSRNVSGNSARCPNSRDTISRNDRVQGPLAGGENIGVKKQGREGCEGSTNSCPLEAARITLHKIDSMSSLMSRAVRNHAANS